MSFQSMLKKAIADAVVNEAKNKITNFSFDALEKFAKEKFNQTVEQVSEISEKVTEKVSNEKGTEFKFNLDKEYIIKDEYIWIKSNNIPNEIVSINDRNYVMVAISDIIDKEIDTLPKNWHKMIINDIDFIAVDEQYFDNIFPISKL